MFTDNATQFYTPSADAGMDQDNGAGDDAPDRQDYLDASPQPGNPCYFMRKTCKAGYFTYFELLTLLEFLLSMSLMTHNL